MTAALSPDELVDLIEQTYASIDQACSGLADDQWDLPTDLPGWTVKDNLSHLVHFEATAIGRPTPDDVDVSRYDYLVNDFQRANERGVEARRMLTGDQVLDEFREVSLERMKALRNTTDWDTEVTIPVGTFKTGDILGIRLSDLFYHEQDIRRTVGRPGHLDGGVAKAIFERFSSAMGYVLVKGAKAPDGTRARFAIAAPGRTFDAIVRGERGEVELPDGDPTATFAGDIETFLCLTGGRWTPEHAIVEGRWQASGDQDLIAAIHASMSVVP